MERVIKFRAWDGSKMIEDFTPRNIIGSYSGKPTYYDTRYGLETPHVMQFTGLQDKNGTPIYEGDIVQTPTLIADDPFYYSLVEYRNDICSYVKAYGVKSFVRLHVRKEEIEVVGNIYETPELLNQLNPSKP